MDKKETKQIKSIETKLKITRVAISLFRERGYKDVSIREICQKADISIGSFYYHFKSKEEIINTAHEQLDYLWENSISLLDFNRSTRENILCLFEEAGRVMQELGWEMTAQSYVHLLTSHKKYAIQRDRPIYSHLQDVISAGLEKGDFYEGIDRETLTNLLVRSGRGILFDWCLMDGSYDLVNKIREDLTIILNSFCR